MDSLISQQAIENIILAVGGFVALGLLVDIARALRTISVAARLSLNPSAAQPALSVSKKEIETMINPTEGGRYARFTFPDSMKPFKETPLG